MNSKKTFDLLKKELQDKEVYRGWQSNIAMAFQDEYNSRKKKYVSKTDIHRISNKAAKSFLSMFLK